MSNSTNLDMQSINQAYNQFIFAEYDVINNIVAYERLDAEVQQLLAKLYSGEFESGLEVTQTYDKLEGSLAKLAKITRKLSGAAEEIAKVRVGELSLENQQRIGQFKDFARHIEGMSALYSGTKQMLDGLRRGNDIEAATGGVTLGVGAVKTFQAMLNHYQRHLELSNVGNELRIKNKLSQIDSLLSDTNLTSQAKLTKAKKSLDGLFDLADSNQGKLSKVTKALSFVKGLGIAASATLVGLEIAKATEDGDVSVSEGLMIGSRLAGLAADIGSLIPGPIGVALDVGFTIIQLGFEIAAAVERAREAGEDVDFEMVMNVIVDFALDTFRSTPFGMLLDKVFKVFDSADTHKAIVAIEKNLTSLSLNKEIYQWDVAYGRPDVRPGNEKMTLRKIEYSSAKFKDIIEKEVQNLGFYIYKTKRDKNDFRLEYIGGDGDDVFMVIGEHRLNLKGGKGDDLFLLGSAYYHGPYDHHHNPNNNPVNGALLNIDAGEGEDTLGLIAIGGESYLPKGWYHNANVKKLFDDTNKLFGLDKIYVWGNAGHFVDVDSGYWLTMQEDGSTITTRIKGFENVVGSDRQDYLIGDNKLFGEDGDDYLWGKDSDNLLNGGFGQDVLIGNGGNDILIGGVGSDVLIAGKGDDILYVDSYDKTVDGSEGVDIAVITDSKIVIESDTFKNIEIFRGNNEDNEITFSSDLSNTPILINGGDGDDIITVNSNGDNNQISGGAGNDVLVGSNNRDVLYSGSGHNNLHGREGEDIYKIDENYDSIRIFDSGMNHVVFENIKSSALNFRTAPSVIYFDGAKEHRGKTGYWLMTKPDGGYENLSFQDQQTNYNFSFLDGSYKLQELVIRSRILQDRLIEIPNGDFEDGNPLSDGYVHENWIKHWTIENNKDPFDGYQDGRAGTYNPISSHVDAFSGQNVAYLRHSSISTNIDMSGFKMLDNLDFRLEFAQAWRKNPTAENLNHFTFNMSQEDGFNSSFTRVGKTYSNTPENPSTYQYNVIQINGSELNNNNLNLRFTDTGRNDPTYIDAVRFSYSIDDISQIRKFAEREASEGVYSFGPVLVGTKGIDHLNGQSLKESTVFYGGDNLDTINGSNYDDLIYGGNAIDTIAGNGGNDVIYGESGADRIIYRKGDGEDILYANRIEGDQLLIDGIRVNEASYRLDYDDLIVEFGDNQSIRIVNWNLEGDDTQRVKFIKFNLTSTILSHIQMHQLAINNPASVTKQYAFEKKALKAPEKPNYYYQENGEISVAEEQDSFEFFLKKGVQYRIDLKGKENDQGVKLDTYFRGIFDETGDFINITNDDVDGTRDSRVFFTPEEDGLYDLQAGAYKSKTGEYSIVVAQESFTFKDDLKEDGAESNVHKAFLRAGETYQVDLYGDDSNGNGLEDPYFRGLSLNGVDEFKFTDDDGAGELNSSITFTAEETGEYLFLAGSYGNKYTGDYVLTITDTDLVA